jgi:hypothetical protein
MHSEPLARHHIPHFYTYHGDETAVFAISSVVRVVWSNGADFDPAILHDWPAHEAAFRAATQ